MSGRSRRELVTAAGAGAALVLGGCGGSDPEPPPGRGETPRPAADLDGLRLVLALEYFATDFYERLLDERLLESADHRIVGRLRDDEEEHVDALERLVAELGGRRPARAVPDFDTLLDGSPEAIMTRASEIENVGAAAYLGQLSNVRGEANLDTLVSIHSVEARHAAGLDHRAGRTAALRSALARPLDASEVRARIARFEL